MKIYMLPVNEVFQPQSQPFLYPSHNKDYGVEQDFWMYVQKNKQLVTGNPTEADWHYLPIFWTRYHLNNDFGRTGLIELKEELDRVILDDKKTFTLCQYDWGPLVDLGQTKVFLSSRITETGLDMPLLCTAHQIPKPKPAKKYLASFAGFIYNHPIRKEMQEVLKDRNDISIVNGNQGTDFFIHHMLEAYIALCPRGHGGSSFRFYEAMQLGVVPFLIGNLDTRPFKTFINWDEVSFYASSVGEINRLLDQYRPKELIEMGKRASSLWRSKLNYQKWCEYVIGELNEL